MTKPNSRSFHFDHMSKNLEKRILTTISNYDKTKVAKPRYSDSDKVCTAIVELSDPRRAISAASHVVIEKFFLERSVQNRFKFKFKRSKYELNR